MAGSSCPLEPNAVPDVETRYGLTVTKIPVPESIRALEGLRM